MAPAAGGDCMECKLTGAAVLYGVGAYSFYQRWDVPIRPSTVRPRTASLHRRTAATTAATAATAATATDDAAPSLTLAFHHNLSDLDLDTSRSSSGGGWRRSAACGVFWGRLVCW